MYKQTYHLRWKFYWLRAFFHRQAYNLSCFLDSLVKTNHSLPSMGFSLYISRSSCVINLIVLLFILLSLDHYSGRQGDTCTSSSLCFAIFCKVKCYCFTRSNVKISSQDVANNPYLACNIYIDSVVFLHSLGIWFIWNFVQHLSLLISMKCDDFISILNHQPCNRAVKRKDYCRIVKHESWLWVHIPNKSSNHDVD